MKMKTNISKFRNVRISKHLTQQEVADISGVSLPTVQRLETNQGDSKISKVKAIADALQVKIDDII